MNTEVLLVANAAEVQNSLLHIRGGGWESYTPGLLPGTVRGSIAGIVTLSPEELGTTPAVTFSASDAEGHVDGFSASMIIDGMRPTATAGVPCRIPFEVPFATVVREPTVVKITMSHDGAELAAVTFAVLSPIPDAPPSN